MIVIAEPRCSIARFSPKSGCSTTLALRYAQTSKCLNKVVLDIRDTFVLLYALPQKERNTFALFVVVSLST